MRFSIHLFRIKLACLLTAAFCCNLSWLVLLAFVSCGPMDGLVALIPLGRGGAEIVLIAGFVTLVCVLMPCSLHIADVFARERSKMNVLRRLPNARAISRAHDRQPKEIRCPRSTATKT